jgi:hypothetical protein
VKAHKVKRFKLMQNLLRLLRKRQNRRRRKMRQRRRLESSQGLMNLGMRAYLNKDSRELKEWILQNSKEELSKQSKY